MKSESLHYIKLLWIYLIGIFFLVTILLVAASMQKSFWIDEFGTINRMQSIMKDIMASDPWDNHFLVDLSMGLWGSVWGYTEPGLRSLAILWALASMLLTYWLARDLLGTRVALMAFTILGLSPLFLLFAHNIRYYSLAACLSLAGALGVFRYHTTGRKAYLLLYLLSGLLLVPTMHKAIIPIIALNIWWVFLWLGKRERTWVELVIWVMLNLLVGLALIPGLERMWNVTSNNTVLQEIPVGPIEIIKRTAFLVYSFSLGETISPLNPVAWIGLLTVAAAGIYAIVANFRNQYFWLPVLFVVSCGIASVFMSFSNPWLSTIWQSLPHWSFYALPFFAIWIAAGLGKLRPKITIVGISVLMVVYAIGIYNYFTDRQFIQPMFTVPWHTIFEKIQVEAEPEDVVMCSGGDVACNFYLKRYGFQNTRLPEWQQFSGDELPDIWLVRTNLSGQEEFADNEVIVKIRDDLLARYPLVDVFNYAQQDESIRWLKSEWLGKVDYEYRVNLYWFHYP